MRIQLRLAVTAVSILALSALGGLAASAQPPSSDATVVEAEDVTPPDTGSDETAAEVLHDAAPVAADGGSGIGGAPAVPATAPATAVTPDTAPLGSSGGGGTGGNGRPPQEPIKDG